MTDNNLHIENKESKNGFTVPGNYFEDAQKQLLSKVNNGGFAVPDDYFKELKEDVLQHISAKPAKIISINRWWYVAAAVILVTSFGLMFPMFNVQPVQSNSSITNDDIIAYMLTYESVGDIPLTEFYNNESTMLMYDNEEGIEQLDEETLLNEL